MQALLKKRHLLSFRRYKHKLNHLCRRYGGTQVCMVFGTQMDVKVIDQYCRDHHDGDADDQYDSLCNMMNKQGIGMETSDDSTTCIFIYDPHDNPLEEFVYNDMFISDRVYKSSDLIKYVNSTDTKENKEKIRTWLKMIDPKQYNQYKIGWQMKSNNN